MINVFFFFFFFGFAYFLFTLDFHSSGNGGESTTVFWALHMKGHRGYLTFFQCKIDFYFAE